MLRVMRVQRFGARVAPGPGGRAVIAVPFDPDEAWGAKAEHPVAGQPAWTVLTVASAAAPWVAARTAIAVVTGRVHLRSPASARPVPPARKQP